MGFCSDCGVHVSEATGLCPICRKAPTENNQGSEATLNSAAPATMGERIAAVAAYFTPIVPLVLLLVPGTRRSPLVRFHALQSLLLHLALAFVGFLIGLIFLSWFSGMIVLIIWPLYGFSFFVLWLLVVIKAGRAELFQVPLLGPVALRGTSV